MSENRTVLDSITSAFVPIHPEGHKFILGFAVAALILFLLAPPLGWLTAIATAAGTPITGVTAATTAPPTQLAIMAPIISPMPMPGSLVILPSC